jgi:hypothetical protein
MTVMAAIVERMGNSGFRIKQNAFSWIAVSAPVQIESVSELFPAMLK